MKIPEFKPKRVFLEDIDLPCFFAKVKNSELPKVAARHIAKYKKDPSCEIWVRSSNHKELTGWPKEMLEQLLEKEGLPAALEEGMRDYETNKAWPGYFKEDEDNYNAIKEHGIVPLMTVDQIIVDEIRRTIILGCHTEWDIHLDEHGIALFWKDGVWRFELGDYLSDYAEEVDDEGRESRWEAVRPPCETTPDTVTDTSFIIGTWVLDADESLAFLKRMKASARTIKETLENCAGRRYEFAPPTFIQRGGNGQRSESVCIGFERRGERITMKYKRPSMERNWQKEMYYCNGLLMELDGLAFRKVVTPV
jgi:hypothetical protein